MKKINFLKFYQTFLLVMLILLIIPLTIGFTQVIFVDYIDYARFSFANTWIKYILILITTALLIYIYWKLMKKNWSSKQFWFIFITIHAVILISRVLWLKLFPINSYYDMNEVLNASFNVANGDYGTFAHNGYLFMAPTNIPITFLLIKVTELMKQLAIPAEWTALARCMQFLNLILMQLITLILSGCVYWISGKNKGKTLFSLIVIAIFFPYLSYTFYVYNDIPSALFYSLMLLFFILYEKKGGIFWALLSAACLAMGNLIRPVGLIFLLAFLFYYLTVKFSRRNLLICLGFLVFFNIPTTIMDHLLLRSGYTYMSLYDEKDIGLSRQLNGICKGFSKGTDDQTPGFFSLPCDRIWQRNDGDYTSASKKYVTMIAEEWNAFHNPADLLQFVYTKYLYQWGDGSFESTTFNDIGREPNLISSFLPEYSPKREMIQRTFVGDWVIQYNQAFWMIMLLTFAASVRKNKESILGFFYLCILGFMAFYLIWEVSPHYLFPLLPILLVLFIIEFDKLVFFLKLLIEKTNFKFICQKE